jgi:hypothetical protein
VLTSSDAVRPERVASSLDGAMDTIRRLPEHFARARLDLELVKEPLVSGRSRSAQVEAIVQIDITPAGRGPQRFRIYPGARGNRVEVLGADRAHRQLVLFVEEPRRSFEVSIGKRQIVQPGVRVVREDATSRTIEQWTPGGKRHFLCGMDEQHLFIAELPCGASSTHAAREALRAPEVPSSLKVRGEPVLRQGEWFFLPLLPRDRSEVAQLVAKGKIHRQVGIAQAARIARSGRPHVADEVVLVEDGPRSAARAIFVRGEVRHPDHQTLVLREFRRTVPNRERFAQPQGVLWID